MRVVYLHQYFTTPDMVGGTRSYEFARRLVRRGHTVDVVTSWREPTDRTDWWTTEVEGIRVHWLPVPYGNETPYARRIAAFVRFAWAAGRRAARLGGDVVFATSTPLTIAIPGVYAARRSRAPFVFEVRDLWPEVPIALGAIRGRPAIALTRRLERWAYANAARVIALSPDMRDGVVGAGVDADRVTVVPNASDVAAFQVPPEEVRAFRARLDWLGDRPLIVYTGTLGRVNAVGYLVRVAKAMTTVCPEARFLIVGDGYEREQVIGEAERYGLLGRTVFHWSGLPKRDVAVVVAAADVATSTVANIPTLSANSANKSFDAFAAGTPLAINYDGWQADLLRTTGAGIVLPPDEPNRAAELLGAFLRDEDRLRAARSASAELGRCRFDRDVLYERFEGVLREAVEEWRG